MNLSMAEMGAKLKISQQVYNNYEKGKNKKFTPEMTTWIQDNFVNNEPPIKVSGADGKILETLVRIEGMQLAHGAYLSEIYAKLFEFPATKILRDMEQMGKDEARKLRDGLKQF